MLALQIHGKKHSLGESHVTITVPPSDVPTEIKVYCAHEQSPPSARVAFDAPREVEIVRSNAKRGAR